MFMHWFIKWLLLLLLLLSCLHLHAGGQDGPLVHFLAHIGKQYGENATLGSEMMRSLVDVSLSRTNLRTMIRNAVIVTNVCIGKCIDGVAKLVTKTDLVGLKSKNKETMVKESEEFLTQARNDVMISQLTPAVKYKIFGVTCMGVTLLLCKKEKQGKEGKTYTLQESKDMFAKDLQAGAPPPPCRHRQPAAPPHPRMKKQLASMRVRTPCFLQRRLWVWKLVLPTLSRTNPVPGFGL